MNTMYEAPFMGFQQQFVHQHQQQQQYRQHLAASAHWAQQAYQANLDYAQAQLYAPASSCPALYSLNPQMQVKSTQQAYQHTQFKLVPAQIAPSREMQPVQGLQAPFFATSSSSSSRSVQESTAPWAIQQSSAYAGQEACHFPLQRHPMMRDFPIEKTFPAPSFSRPPSTEDLQQSFAANLADIDSLKGLKLIPASASEIPPHPPVEKSGVPFADFAIDLVWEICQNAKEQAVAMHGTGRFDHSPTTGSPGQFGSIGGERAARQRKTSNSTSRHAAFNDLFFTGSGPSSGFASYLSSPESPASPKTPPSSTISSACPIPTQFQNGKAEFMHTPRQVAPWTRDRWNTVSSSSPPNPEFSGPSPAFRRFVKDLLTLTLITPQVLLLALYYVAKLPATDSALPLFANHGMPYRVILGALICSNKVFEDNSFRSSTWSTVSQCPIADTVAVETLVLRHLNFDLNVSTSNWTSWLHSLVERRARQQPTFDDPVLTRLCTLIDEC